MRIIFAGTPDFAAETLKALLTTDYEICAVYTQPDRPSGRGRKLTASPVKNIALENHLSVEQPLNFKSDDDQKILSSYNADLMIVVAYGLLLPQSVLDIPTLGCINIHASLLPRWRGAAPIQRAILAGDQQTGICIMQMEKGLDTGPVLAKAICSISEDDSAKTLHDRLAILGSKTLLTTLPDIKQLQKKATLQDESLTCYADKLQKQEAVIDWQKSSHQILRQVNAFNPWPVAQTVWQGDTFRIWAASTIETEHNASVGEVIAVNRDSINIATGQGVLCLKQVQIPGKRAMPVVDFLNANKIAAGDSFG